MTSTRREFLQESAAVTAAVGVAAITGNYDALAQTPPTGNETTAFQPLPTPASIRKGDMLYRKLGRTGELVSLIGLGGYHIGIQPDEQDSIRLIRSAIDRGITFLDNSWDYNNGNSEIRMGKALQDGYRSKVFLMTKIDGRAKESAARQIDESLRRLQTDRVDLLQLHEVVRNEDPDRIFAAGGAIEALQEAKKAGKIRYIGFTGHKDPAIHLHMLELAAKRRFHFDTVQMPVNVLDPHYRSFTRQVLPVLVRDRIGALAMKTFGGGVMFRDVVGGGATDPIEMLHFSMTLPVSVVITGIERTEQLDQAFEAVKTFQPMTTEQVTSLLAKTRPLAAEGKYERFKSSHAFDSTFHSPQWFDS